LCGLLLGCPWQRCSVHFLREALGHVREDQHGMVAALLRPLFSAEGGEAARGPSTRRCPRSPRPEPPTMPTNYTTSWDLTPAQRSK
jgi:transposase-like protein